MRWCQKLPKVQHRGLSVSDHGVDFWLNGVFRSTDFKLRAWVGIAQEVRECLEAKLEEAEMQKILLVDDDPHIREIAQISLEDDFNVVLAASGPEALQLSQVENPDLIILDMMMPGMDGVTTLAKLRENAQTANIPVIFMTAKVQAQELDSYRALDVAGVLSKPFDPMKLPGEIRRIVENR